MCKEEVNIVCGKVEEVKSVTRFTIRGARLKTLYEVREMLEKRWCKWEERREKTSCMGPVR